MPDEEYSIMSKGIVKKEMVDEAVACPCSPPAPAPRAHPSPAPIPRIYGCVARAWRPNLRPRGVYFLLEASTGKQWGSLVRANSWPSSCTRLSSLHGSRSP